LVGTHHRNCPKSCGIGKPDQSGQCADIFGSVPKFLRQQAIAGCCNRSLKFIALEQVEFAGGLGFVIGLEIQGMRDAEDKFGKIFNLCHLEARALAIFD
jgi:hypothetical protein